MGLTPAATPRPRVVARVVLRSQPHTRPVVDQSATAGGRLRERATKARRTASPSRSGASALAVGIKRHLLVGACSSITAGPRPAHALEAAAVVSKGIEAHLERWPRCEMAEV